MSLYMLDTNMVSHLVRNHPEVARRVRQVPMSDVCVSAVTEGELLFGLARRPEATQLAILVGEFLRRVQVLPWDFTVAKTYGRVRAALQQAGRALAPMDLLIGSHALSVKATLVTNDTAFGAMHGLALEDWTVAATP